MNAQSKRCYTGKDAGSHGHPNGSASNASSGFNRAIFEAKVKEKSPLLPRHFDVMLGDVEAKKALAWQIMQMPAAKQYAILEDFQRCRVHFPNTTVENAK